MLQVFEEQLPQAMNAQPFAQLLNIQSVKRIIQDSDGYQPFLVAPENGYRALVREGVKLMETPAATAVDAVDMVLRDIGQKVCFFFHTNSVGVEGAWRFVLRNSDRHQLNKV